MTENLPDYDAIEPPDDVEPSEYSTHERRAAVWREISAKGSPARVNKAALSRRFDVARSTIHRDFNRLQEWIGDSLSDDAKVTTRALFERTVRELLEADDWKATKAAWDVVQDWNDWLADLGEQHREPRQSELDVDVQSRHAEVAYRVVREGEDDPLPTTDDGDGAGERVDYDELGFTSAPTSIEITGPDRSDTDE